ncbi:MAG: TonB-dependent receptor [Burkholderiales bacterium]|nr:TonB-dependent receptor [Burkholderiales bacterium]MDE1927714.1 TonB-dependent receptor [Burkholderiales bacterium]MDE2158308.1 TonB-dependent receptor [Burkholderiales bacterium]MDE2503824.1 TonB-dependent receptor [Burkholderiales bacterium]
MNYRIPALQLLPLAVAMIYAPQIRAQSADNGQVIEITAQKRSERIIDVPLAVTAISGAAMEDRGIEGPSALAGLVPNLNMAQAPVSGLIASVGMRGITSGQPSIWADPAVGMYVDGVFVGKNMGALFDIIDTARVEALRGPQGTLFGRNTEAGAINFITRKPSGEFSGSVGAEFGNYNRKVARASIDLPKIGPVSASIALRSEKQDGFIANPAGAAWGGKNRQAARLALRFDAGKDLTVDYALDYSHINETPPAGSLISSTGYGSLYSPLTQIGGTTYAFQNPTCLAKDATGTCVFPSPGIAPGTKPYVNPNYPSSVTGSSQLGPDYQRLNLIGHSLIAKYKLNAHNTLKYIGALRDMKYGDHGDYDGTPMLVFDGIRDTNYKAQSHELQWIGDVGALRYVGGIYYLKDNGTTLQNQAGTLLTFTPALVGYQAANFYVSTESKAAYGQLDYDIGAFGIGVGGRYTQDTKGVHAWRYKTDAAFNQQGADTVDASSTARFSQFTPTFNLIYRLNTESNLFARVAQGFKSGGFPAEAPVTASSGPTRPFSPEKSTAYEFGYKTALLGGKGQFSANVFFTQVKDFQVSLLPAGSISPTIVNAGKMQSQGLEVDGALAPIDGTRLTLSYGYLDAKFKQYQTLSATGQPVDAASNTVVAGAPRHTFTLGIDQRVAQFASGTTLRGLVDLRYVADRYTYPAEISATAPNATVGNSVAESHAPALTELDLHLIVNNIKIGGPGDAELSFFVKNALNQRKMVAQMDVSGFYQVGFWSDPRTFGLKGTYRW